MLSIFLLICFIISSLTVSFISSLIKNQASIVNSRNFGYDSSQCVNYILILNENGKYDDLKEQLVSIGDNYRIILARNIEAGLPKIHDEKFGDLELQANIMFNKQDRELDLGIIDGRFPKDSKDNEIILGKEVDELLEKPKKVSFWGTEFNVVGTFNGYLNRSMVINNNILDKYFLGNTEISKRPIFFKIIKEDGALSDKDRNLIYKKLSDIENSNGVNEITTGAIKDSDDFVAMHEKKSDIKLNGILILIAICNVIVVSTFWIMDRKKEIAIRKAFGADKKHIVSLIYKELGALMSVTLIICITIQCIGSVTLSKIFDVSLNLSVGNLVSLMIMGFLIVILGSIIPIKRALTMEISECLKE